MSALSSGTPQGQMCPAVPSQDTKAIYLPEMTACVWVCIYHTHCFRNHGLSRKTEVVRAPCSCFNGGGELCNVENDNPLGQCSQINITRMDVATYFPSRDTLVPLSPKTKTAS